MAEPVRKMPADREPQADPFRYGWRWQRVRLPSGEETVQQIPLTPEDLLNPELDDEVPHSPAHFKLMHRLATILMLFFEPRQDVLVTGDMKMLWGIPGLAEPAPDLVVIQDVRKRDALTQASFDVVKEGTRPCLIIEVVSPLDDVEVRRNDYERKVEIYQRTGIPEYLIYETPAEETDCLLVIGYSMGPDGRYRRIEPDAQGLLLSKTTGLLFGVDEDGQTPLVIEAVTGRRLLTSAQEEAARKAAEAEVARLRAELERLKKDAKG
jgi:Uma2 family endonuclease